MGFVRYSPNKLITCLTPNKGILVVS